MPNKPYNDIGKLMKSELRNYNFYNCLLIAEDYVEMKNLQSLGLRDDSSRRKDDYSQSRSSKHNYGFDKRGNRHSFSKSNVYKLSDVTQSEEQSDYETSEAESTHTVGTGHSVRDQSLQYKHNGKTSDKSSRDSSSSSNSKQRIPNQRSNSKNRDSSRQRNSFKSSGESEQRGNLDQRSNTKESVEREKSPRYSRSSQRENSPFRNKSPYTSRSRERPVLYKCNFCKVDSHMFHECDMTGSEIAKVCREGGLCYICSHPGHMATDCPVVWACPDASWLCKDLSCNTDRKHNVKLCSVVKKY